jgi:hypothetical protein
MGRRKVPLSVSRGALVHGKVRLPVYYYLLDMAKTRGVRTDHVVGAILTQYVEDCKKADELARQKLAAGT